MADYLPEDREQTSNAVLQAALNAIFGVTSAGLHDPGSLIGRLGQSLYGDDSGEYYVDSNGKRVRATGSGNFQTPEAQKVFNALTNAASATGVPRDLLFKYAWNAKDGPPMMGSGAQGENILAAAKYLESTEWGRQLLVSNPQLRKLKAELDKAKEKYPDKDAFAAALKADPGLIHLQELIKDPKLGALVTAVNIRQVLVEKYHYNPESAEPLSPEIMREAGGEIFLTHHLGKEKAEKILARAKDHPEDTSPVFSEEEIKANPLLAPLAGKSAHQIVEWAQDKMSIDVSPLLQAAYNHRVATVYNDIDAQNFHGVSMAGLKAAIGSNETGNMTQEAAYRVVNSIGAVGKYQIMKFNIETKPGVKSWPEEALGRRMTVEEFRNDPAAQEAVASYMYQKYADMSWRRHGGSATPEQIIKDVASYWQSGTDYDTAVKQHRTDGHWTTAQYGEEAWKAYQRLPPVEIAMTKNESGAPKATDTTQLSLSSLGMGGATPVAFNVEPQGHVTTVGDSYMVGFERQLHLANLTRNGTGGAGLGALADNVDATSGQIIFHTSGWNDRHHLKEGSAAGAGEALQAVGDKQFVIDADLVRNAERIAQKLSHNKGAWVLPLDQAGADGAKIAALREFYKKVAAKYGVAVIDINKPGEATYAHAGDIHLGPDGYKTGASIIEAKLTELGKLPSAPSPTVTAEADPRVPTPTQATKGPYKDRINTAHEMAAQHMPKDMPPATVAANTTGTPTHPDYNNTLKVASTDAPKTEGGKVAATKPPSSPTVAA